MSPEPEASEKTVASNRRARHDYDIKERFEAGIVLTGSEVKSLRQGRASVAEAYARQQGGELWLEQMHIPPYEQGEKRGYDPLRPRKLLLHRKEIERVIQQQKEQSLALVRCACTSRTDWPRWSWGSVAASASTRNASRP